MSAEYTPPKSGSPCWIEIPATEVVRAKDFYGKVFEWNFHPASEEYPTEGVALFSYPDPKLSGLGGGIVHREEAKMKRGTGGVVVYLFVESTEDSLEKIKTAGGKAVGEKYPEGKMGWIQLFEDTEGNVGGMWTPVRDSEK